MRELLFLSRVHPKKGLVNLAKAYAQLKPKGWQVIVAGPAHGTHKQQLERLLADLGVLSDFSFVGPVAGLDKQRLYESAELFVLPSMSENFGIVVAEALAAGLPVITTRGTPWKELVTHRCGWWIDLGVEPLVAALREATALGDAERWAMGERGRRLIRERYSWDRIGQDMESLYRWILGLGPKPACVVERGDGS